jgi:hypothetical protein
LNRGYKKTVLNQKISCKIYINKKQFSTKYTGERAWISIGDRLQGLCYLSRDDHDRKIRARKQRTDIGKYCFVNRAIKLWN